MKTAYLLQGADTGLGWLYAYACWRDAADAYVAWSEIDEMIGGIKGLLTAGGDDA